MATYAEIQELASDATLKNKVRTACWVKAAATLADANAPAARREWAQAAFDDGNPFVEKLLRYLIAKAAAAPKATIEASSDATVQTEVGNAIDAIFPAA